MSEADTVLIERDGPVTIVAINRPHCRNAVDGLTARKLFDAFRAFDADDSASVAVFTGVGGPFCAGADLKAVAAGDPNKKREIGGHDSIAPMGPSRPRLTKPVIAAVEGFAVAGGMVLPLCGDMRVVAEDATFGIFCRRFGVPLIDLGTLGLRGLIGHAQAIDLILTGRPVGGPEALRMGLANRLVPKGETRTHAIALAKDIARFPQTCMRADRLSALRQWDLEEEEAIANEMLGGLKVLDSRETLSGATRVASGMGRWEERRATAAPATCRCLGEFHRFSALSQNYCCRRAPWSSTTDCEYVFKRKPALDLIRGGCLVGVEKT